MEYKILMIEDNAGDVLLVKEALNIHNISSTLNVLRDGEEALIYLQDKLSHTPEDLMPDLIILDLNIPKLDGRHVLNAIKQKETLKKIPVIVFSSSSYDIDEKVCSELGADLFLTKPIEFEQYTEVIKAIKRLLDKR